MNFPTGESRVHQQTIDLTGNISIDVPTGFTVTDANGGIVVGSNLTFGNLTSSLSFNWTSPSSCNQSDMFVSRIRQNSITIGEFRFLCIDDLDVVDFKVEYGHGEGNYLDSNELFIPTDEVVLFNLVRLFPLGHTLVPNANMENATIRCMYPDRTVRTYGRVEVEHDFDNNKINGTYFWRLINSGFWFRIGVLSQDTHDFQVGDTFNVSCDQLTYSMGTHQVQAPFTNYSLLFVTKTPFNFTTFNDTQNPGNFILEVKNTEVYTPREVELVFQINNNTQNIMIPEIRPNESYFFRLEDTEEFNISAFFVPPWFHNSFEDDIYVEQRGSLNPLQTFNDPVIGTFTCAALFINDSFQTLVNGTDADGDVFNFTDDAPFFTINSSTGLVNFTHNGTYLGNFTVTITLTDDTGRFDNTTAVCELLNVTAPTPNATPTPPTTGGGGGGKPSPYTPPSGGGGAPSCRENWNCGEWDICVDGWERRTCTDFNDCGTIYDQPQFRRRCVPLGALLVNVTFEPTCFDGIQNQGEVGIDCGGPCDECAIVSLEAPESTCGDEQCVFAELFACKEDCAIPSFLILLILFGLFFAPIFYFEYFHYHNEHEKREAIGWTSAIFLFLVIMAYNAITHVTQLTVLFWGIIAALVIIILYLFENS